MDFPILSSILLCPVIALVIVLLTPARYENAVRYVSLAASLATLVLSLVLVQNYDSSGAAMQFTERAAWIPAMGIDYVMGVDGISVTMVLLTSIIIFCGVIVSWTVTDRVKMFYANMLFLVAGVFGVFMTTNLFFFFLFYEVAVLPMYLLIILWGSTNKEYAGMKLTLYLLLGSAFIFAGFLYLYAMPGSGTFDLLKIKETVQFSPELQYILYPVFFVGFGVLAAVFPFHVWSPDGHVAAPTAASMLHAGVLMKLGTYGILRIGIYLFPQGAADWAFVTACLALTNILYGAMVATQQRDLKYMIGFSSVSHMGLVILGLSSLNAMGINGAVFQMFSHGIMTALFFACVGYVYDHCHTRMLDELGGLSRVAPWICGIFITAGLVGLGLPGFSGFVAELLVIIGAVEAYPVIGLASILGLLITAYYVLTAMQRAFYGPVNAKLAGRLPDLSSWQLFPRLALVGVLLLFGIFPQWFLSLIQTSTHHLLAGA